MTVKQLIGELLNLEMDSEVAIVFEKKNGNYKYRNIDAIVDYYDGSIGIVGYNKKPWRFENEN